jgi:hypothetical protein
MRCKKRMGNYLLNSRKFSKKVIRSPKSTANGAAEWELGRGNRKSKMICSTVKYL